jgi:hypothetical protein
VYVGCLLLCLVNARRPSQRGALNFDYETKHLGLPLSATHIYDILLFQERAWQSAIIILFSLAF